MTIKFPLSWMFAALALVAGASHGQSAATSPDKIVKRGERLFLQCSSCHEITEVKTAKIGPTLKAVADRPVASLEGYNYSPALKGFKFAWDDANLDRWLMQPMQMAPGTTMAFAGVPAPEDRKAIIAYLRTLK